MDDRDGVAGVGDAAGVEATDVHTVESLNRAIAGVVDGADLRRVSVVGEVTDCNETDTALYFTLTDTDGGSAEVDCVLWQSRYRSLDVTVESGQAVLAAGAVDYWVEGGRLSLKPRRVVPVGEGERARRIAQLRADLEERGWFDDAHKRRPPRYPDRVGVVTSRDGDARHDVRTSIHERNPTVDVVLRHATVQGEDAPTAIADGIHHLDRHADVDAIVVGRGGGSETDLAAFDTEPVAEAIFTAETPVVAAVGHTEDQTVAGEVADVDAITPTDAGEVVAPLDRLAERVDGLAERLEAASVRAVDDRLGALGQRLDRAHAARRDDAVADLQRRLSTAHAGLTTAELQRLTGAVETGYERHRSRTLARLDTDLRAAYGRRVDRRLAALSNDVETAYRELERASDHERRLRRLRRRYRALVAALTVALVVVLAWALAG